MEATELWLRVVQINDVYELDNFPSFHTLVQEKKRGPDLTLVVVAGDFLAPSLLSSLDHGAAMVDVLNHVGVTHVCFGNHECDVPMEDLKKHITESSQFVWVNSNMQDINHILNMETPEYDIVTVTNSKGQSKRVALLGLLTNEPGLYRPGSYGNARIEPIMDCTDRLLRQLDGQVDFWLPITHQSNEDDRVFAKRYGSTFPIVMGGHDHSLVNEVVNDCHIVKAEYDAHYASVVDIQWNNLQSEPVVSAEIIPTTTYRPDPNIHAIVNCHWQLIRELERAKLFHVHQWTQGQEFSTCGNRLGPTHGSTALTTMLRMGMQAQCGLLNAGSIRGNTKYWSNSFFTWSDLKAEIPFPTTMVVLNIPGKVLEATIRHSRQPSRLNPPVAHGSFIHTCNNIVYDDVTQTITSIQGIPMVPEKLYMTTLNSQFIQGIDNHEPILEWAAANPNSCNLHAAVPAKVVLVELFSALLWLQLGSFSEMDLNGDGVLTRDEIQLGVSRHYGDSSVADLVVDNVMSIADIFQNGVISPLEMVIVHLVATDMISPRERGNDNNFQEAMRETAARVLSVDNLDDERVTRLVEHIEETLYVDEYGSLKRVEHERTLGELRQQALLI